MFWSKCSKLLVNASGQLINCDNCPCGYWAVLGFKWRWLDCDTMQPDLCSWNYSVQAKEVKDNKVDWDYCCIEISQNMGLCGTKKGKFNCWSDCYNWDDEGNCIQQMQQCDCIQVEVYNISGCYDKFNEFEAAFWGGCGVTPDSSGNYPAMWQYWYGSQYQSSAAYDCVENYWQKIFEDKYLLNFKVELQAMNQSWWQGALGYEYEQQAYNYCGDANCYYQSQYQGSCADGLQVCTDYLQGQHTGFKAYCFMENAGSSLSLDIHTASVPDPKSNIGWCCAENSTAAAVPEINAFITEKVNDKSVYMVGSTNTYECKHSANLCSKITYETKCWDNYYGDFAGCRITFNWARIKLLRNDRTPADAKGVKFLVNMVHTRENIGYEKDEKIVENLSMQLSINFDEISEDLPLATNTNLLSILDTPSCDDKCNVSSQDDGTGHPARWWKNSPHINWWDETLLPYPNDAWADKYQVQIIGKEYIK